MDIMAAASRMALVYVGAKFGVKRKEPVGDDGQMREREELNLNGVRAKSGNECD